MEWVLIILLIPSVYFSARFLLLSNNIREVTKDYKEIHQNSESNSKLTLKFPDRSFERLLVQINNHLAKTQLDRIRYAKREEEIRKEIENISHDLRTPLTSIRGYLELLNDETTTEEERKEYISVVERKAKGLHNLIETFYDLSRLEGNNYRINLETMDINKELREHLLLFYNDFEKKHINVELDLCRNQVDVQLDKIAIERVFNNLIQNSIRYAKTSFRVVSKIKDKSVDITFGNDIQQMDKEEVELLFNRFYMGDASRNNNSSGLGLTITKLLVETMGGKINAEIIDGWIIFKVKFTLMNH
ncbi:two-component sensor histidine kinase [Vallitalea longa]|uniref:histidine kinase n=1 Tax=Vallitalea longa TaxID=2936439 RepID=A0A9W5Y867_9FIRM|nr:HAMP domain-containing sensor histidine kinase [Vallitalea longa]GKX27710.1 two-component sensor histidine kinase [Vallitalea longa]